MSKKRPPTRWQGIALTKARCIEYEMSRLLDRLNAASEGCPRSTVLASVREPVEDAVNELLMKVRVIAGEREPDPNTSSHRAPGLIQKITGSAIDATFVNLHAAEVLLVDLYEEEDISARAPDVLARLRTCLPDSDRRCVTAHSLFDKSNLHAQPQTVRPPGRRRSFVRSPATAPACGDCANPQDQLLFALRRTEFRRTMQLSYDAADERYAGLRSFRNVLSVASIVLTTLVAILCLVGFVAPEAINMCFDPPAPAVPSNQDATRQALVDQAAQAAAELSVRMQQIAATGPGETAGSHVCPSLPGLAEPSRFDLSIIALMGLLGGALSASIAIQQMRGTSTQYSVPLALTILKLPAGALTAIIGLILVHGSFIPGLSNLDTQGQILAWAVLLGFAQHLVTRTIDQKAKDVLDSLPTKEGPQRTETTTVQATSSTQIVVPGSPT